MILAGYHLSKKLRQKLDHIYGGCTIFLRKNILEIGSRAAVGIGAQDFHL